MQAKSDHSISSLSKTPSNLIVIEILNCRIRGAKFNDLLRWCPLIFVCLCQVMWMPGVCIGSPIFGGLGSVMMLILIIFLIYLEHVLNFRLALCLKSCSCWQTFYVYVSSDSSLRARRLVMVWRQLLFSCSDNFLSVSILVVAESIP